MVMTIDVPEKIVRDAAAEGISVEQQLQRLAEVERGPDLTGLIPIGQQFATPEEAQEARNQAYASIRDFASRHTLGGLSIKALRDEGRKY